MVKAFYTLLVSHSFSVEMLLCDWWSKSHTQSRYTHHQICRRDPVHGGALHTMTLSCCLHAIRIISFHHQWLQPWWLTVMSFSRRRGLGKPMLKETRRQLASFRALFSVPLPCNSPLPSPPLAPPSPFIFLNCSVISWRVWLMWSSGFFLKLSLHDGHW